MPERTPCQYCRKVGFVRRERVIRGTDAMISFYCGACNRSWQAPEEDDAAPPSDRRGSSVQ